MSLRIQPSSAEAACSAAFLRRFAAPARPLDGGIATRWGAHLAALDAPEPVQRNFDRLKSGAAAIVSGQQAGVLGGPLLTLLKASRAVSLAREVEAATGRPIVPVFWVAADDHDLDEIHHTFVVNRAGDVQKLRLELGGVPRRREARSRCRPTPLDSSASSGTSRASPPTRSRPIASCRAPATRSRRGSHA